MKEDNISQLDDYDAPFCEQQYKHGSCYISNFRHLLSCDTIAMTIFRLVKILLKCCTNIENLDTSITENLSFA